MTVQQEQHRAFLGRLESANYFDLLRSGLEWINFRDLLPAQGRVFIKPNLTFPSYREGVMTHPLAVEAAIRTLLEYTPHVYIGDADGGGYNRFSMDDVYQATGIAKFAQTYGVQVVNLSQVERKPLHFQYKQRQFTLDMPRLLLDDIDMLITMPVPKVHTNTGVSLTFKNQWGCIPEPTDRLRLHPFLKHVLIEVNRAVHAQVAIVDGTYGLNTNGPMRGVPVALDWMLVSSSLGAGAQLACALMQIPLKRIPHLRYAQQMGLIPAMDAITLNTDYRPFLREPFKLKRAWTDYPGYLAFRHPYLAYLAYFSPLADLLHRLLYLVREPFYDHKRPAG